MVGRKKNGSCESRMVDGAWGMTGGSADAGCICVRREDPVRGVVPVLRVVGKEMIFIAEADRVVHPLGQTTLRDSRDRTGV